VTTPAVGMLLASILASAEGPRVALLVGNDFGSADEQPLHYTGADADRLAAVLLELGGFAPGDVHVLKGKTAAEIIDAVDLLAKGPPASLLVFYYSGHADAAALHPAGTLLPVDLLMHRLLRVAADLRISILDACQSGATTRAKGSTPAAPFVVRLDDQSSAGDIFISSSAADEQSFESEHGGLFTLHWTAGLRGAADANGDGRVTLGEVYEYAYAQTLRSTLAASTGPQHARFRYELAGRRDPVLTQLGGGSLLTLRPQSDGEYVIFDSRERSVMAEMPTRPGGSQRLALAPGGYVVQQRGLKSLRVARIQLERGDDRVLSEYQMQEVPLLQLSRKGSLGEVRLTVAGGQYFSGLGPDGLFLASMGLGWEGQHWVPGVDLAFSAGDEEHNGLTTHDVFVQASGSILYTVRMGSAAFRFGPAAGLAYVRQASTGHEALNSLGLSLGARVVLEIRITQAIGLHASADGRALAVRMADKSSGIGVEPWGAYGIGLIVAL